MRLAAASELGARTWARQGTFAVDCSVPMSRLSGQIQQVVPVFSELETPPALMFGLALAAHKVVRKNGGQVHLLRRVL